MSLGIIGDAKFEAMIMEKTTERSATKNFQNKSRWKAIVLVTVVLTSVLFISGCAQQTAIKTSEEASAVVTNVSTDVQDVASTLEDIDRTLGGG